MQANFFNKAAWWPNIDLTALSAPSQALLLYGALMWLAFVGAYIASRKDLRTLRDVGIWAKPMKFMSATALFAWTTVWLAELANPALTHGQAYVGICLLLVATSFFEVAYITFQAWRGAASHYNTSDAWGALMFGLMALGAVGLTATQGWLAWEIWQSRATTPLSVTAWGVILGLVLTLVLSTVSGFMLGGKQPPAGKGLPIVGWHLHKDVRPAHFLGVHAQQFIPLWGVVVAQLFGTYAMAALVAGSILYTVAWGLLAWVSLRD